MATDAGIQDAAAAGEKFRTSHQRVNRLLLVTAVLAVFTQMQSTSRLWHSDGTGQAAVIDPSFLFIPMAAALSASVLGLIWLPPREFNGDTGPPPTGDERRAARQVPRAFRLIWFSACLGVAMQILGLAWHALVWRPDSTSGWWQTAALGLVSIAVAGVIAGSYALAERVKRSIDKDAVSPDAKPLAGCPACLPVGLDIIQDTAKANHFLLRRMVIVGLSAAVFLSMLMVLGPMTSSGERTYPMLLVVLPIAAYASVHVLTSRRRPRQPTTSEWNCHHATAIRSAIKNDANTVNLTFPSLILSSLMALNALAATNQGKDQFLQTLISHSALTIMAILVINTIYQQASRAYRELEGGCRQVR